MFFSAIGRAGVRLVDAILSRYYGLFEYTPDPTAILRLSRSHSLRDLVLRDGTRIQKGAPILILHFRNDRLARVLGSGVSLDWVLVFVRGGRRSLKELAEFLHTHREFDDVRALYADFGFVQDDRLEQMQRLMPRLGFYVIPRAQPGWDVRERAFWDNLFSWWLMWTFNPASLRGKSFVHMRRIELWMTGEELGKKYEV